MTAPARQSILGVILAGGLSRRMEGREKSLVDLDGKPLVARAIERLAPQAGPLVINANGDPLRFSAFDLPVIADTIEGYAGPLAGVLAAMRHARTLEGITHVLTAAADTPFFPLDLAARFGTRLAGETARADAICLAASDGNRHPVFGLWPVSLAEELERFLVAEEGRKVMLFVHRHPWFEVDFPFRGSLDPFFNVNTPDDLSEAERLARSGLAA